MILSLDVSAAYLERVLVSLRDKDLTYTEVGHTREQALPPGYRHQRTAAVVGYGAAAWERTKEAVASWQAHRHAGLDIYPPGASPSPGTVVLAMAHVDPACLVLPCRVVYGTDEPKCFGFAYGTLPGHPERGEESFHAIWDSEDAVSFQVVAFSRPADLVTRLAGPVANSFQSIATRRYLRGVQTYVATGTSGAG